MKKQVKAKKKCSAIAELLEFIEKHGDTPLDREEADRLFDLDLRAGEECRRRKIDVPVGDPKDRTPLMKLACGRESIYKYAGNLALDGPGDIPEYSRIIVAPDDDWLNWLRAVERLLHQTKPDKPPSRRATFADKIDRLTREMKDFLRAAQDHAYSTLEHDGTPQLLPRPTQTQLAKQLGMTPSDVCRALKDNDAAELKLYWAAAEDLDRVMGRSVLNSEVDE